MSTPPGSPWGPPSDDQDRPNPYAAPEGASPDGTPSTDPATGYPVAPPPSGYEARSPGSAAPVPPPYGSTAWTAGGAPSPYDANAQYPYGSGPAPTPGAGPYGAGPTPYGAPTPPVYGAGQPTDFGPGPYPSTPYPSGPGYGYPAGPGTQPGPWGPPQRPTDSLAIASLITACAGALTAGLTGPVGLGLGIGALRRIRRTGSGGRGLAIAGIAVGSFFTVVLLAVGAVIAWAASQPSSFWEDGSDTIGSDSWWDDQSDGDGGTDTADDTLPAYELPAWFAPGDCFADYPQTYDMSDGDLVDCAAPHDGEVIGLVDLTGPVSTDLTADDPVADAAWDACTAQITGLLGADPGSIGAEDVFFPHPDQWDAGSHSAYCLLVTNDWVSGSLVAGSLELPGTPSTT